MSRRLILPAAAVVASVAVALTVSGRETVDADTATPDGVDVLRAEIDALEGRGATAEGKADQLEADLAALEQGAQRAMPGEPGLDLSDVLGTGPGGGARSLSAEAEGTDAAVAWDRGVVDCEPLPPELLTVEDIAGARCLSVPQPDGTSRYLAIAPDGTVRVVRFGTDGEVTREPDLRVEDLPTDGLPAG